MSLGTDDGIGRGWKENEDEVSAMAYADLDEGARLIQGRDFSKTVHAEEEAIGEVGKRWLDKEASDEITDSIVAGINKAIKEQRALLASADRVNFEHQYAEEIAEELDREAVRAEAEQRRREEELLGLELDALREQANERRFGVATEGLTRDKRITRATREGVASATIGAATQGMALEHMVDLLEGEDSRFDVGHLYQ